MKEHDDLFGQADTIARQSSLGTGTSTSQAALPTYSIDQIADYLREGYWESGGSTARQWGVDTVTFNVGALTAAGATLARAAMEIWDSIIAIDFVETTGSAMLTFDDNRSGAYASSTYSLTSPTATITSAHVNIHTSWVATYGTEIDSYSLQTYIHESGHALGLGHPGPYDGGATYGVDNIYANDTWQYTIMSYFDQPNYGGASYRFVIGPQLADIKAATDMYGAETDTRTGNTTYGFNSNAGDYFDFALFDEAPAYTIFDSAGSDTLDVSGYGDNQLISLIEGTFSNIGGLIGNIAIAFGVVIENAIGGSGDDTILGNAAANLLKGGDGDDRLAAGIGDRLDGGGDFDTVTLDGLSSFALADLGVSARLEAVDLGGGGAQTLIIDPTDGAKFTGGMIWVDGDAGDTVQLLGGGWTETGATTRDGRDYTQYADGGTTVAAESGVAVTGAAAPGSRFSIAAQSADQDEGRDGSRTSFTFLVTRAGGTDTVQRADWSATGNGAHPADAGDFYGGVLPSGSLRFAEGETAKTVTVRVQGDAVMEDDEGFSVTLSNATNGATIGTDSASGIIRNDDFADPAVLSIAAETASITEGDSGSTLVYFTVSRAGDTPLAQNVYWNTAGSGAVPADAADFNGGMLPSGVVRFAAGETVKTIAVRVLGDTMVEGNERFTVSLRDPTNGASLGTDSAATTILNDDAEAPAALFSIAAQSADRDEGRDGATTSFTFRVTRAGDTDIAQRVDWSAVGSGAAPADAADFYRGLLPEGSLRFAEGETAKTITIRVQGDAVTEGDETFTVTLDNPTNGAGLDVTTATGMIRDDDLGPVSTISIAADQTSIYEGDSSTTRATFTVSRTGDTSGSQYAYWDTAGSGSYPADGADFQGGTLPTGIVRFAAGETVKTISVRILGDTLVESNERFTLDLHDPSTGVALGTNRAAVIIRNDDDGISQAALAWDDTASPNGSDVHYSDHFLI